MYKALNESTMRYPIGVTNVCNLKYVAWVLLFVSGPANQETQQLDSLVLCVNMNIVTNLQKLRMRSISIQKDVMNEIESYGSFTQESANFKKKTNFKQELLGVKNKKCQEFKSFTKWNLKMVIVPQSLNMALLSRPIRLGALRGVQKTPKPTPTYENQSPKRIPKYITTVIYEQHGNNWNSSWKITVKI